MRRIQNSIALAKASWEVLKADKELMVLPIISAVTTLIVAATFIAPLFFASGIDVENDSVTAQPVFYIIMFVMYVALAYVTIFFNAALVHAANERLEGGDPTVKSALAGARARATKILPWAIVSATVSIILRAIEERAGFVGQIVASIAGLAWSLVTFLVLPILVIEGIGVRDAVRESGRLFKQTWGENVAAQVGFGILGFVAAIPGILLIVVGAGVGGVGGIALVAVAIGWIGLVAVAMATLSGIFQTALYRFARDGTAGAFFDDGTLRSAFAPK